MLNRGNAGPIRAAADALEVSPGATVADIGFGGGASLPLLLDRVGTTGRVHGVDPAHAMVTAAARRFRQHLAAGRLELHDGSLEELPFRDAAIDGAITVNTIYFVSDLAVAFRECARVLRPGGQLIVGLGDPAAMSRMPVTSHGFKLRSVAEVDASLTTAGLSVMDHRRVGTDDDAHHLLISATPMQT